MALLHLQDALALVLKLLFQALRIQSETAHAGVRDRRPSYRDWLSHLLLCEHLLERLDLLQGEPSLSRAAAINWAETD
jgi:hypothetical protein